MPCQGAFFLNYFKCSNEYSTLKENKDFPAPHYKMTGIYCICRGLIEMSLPIAQQLLGQLLIFLAVKLPSCIVLDWNSSPTGVSTHHHLSLHPPTGRFDCSVMENVGPDAWVGSQKFFLKFLYVKINSTVSNFWPKCLYNSSKSHFSRESEPVCAGFILRGTRCWNVHKLMGKFYIYVQQTWILSNFDC